MKRYVAVILAFLLFVGQIMMPFSVCAEGGGQQALQEVLQEVNARNEKLDAPRDSLEAFRYPFDNKKPKLSEQDIRLMWKDYERRKIKKRISVSSAIKEMKWLFRLFRSQYGLYTYYGGDAAFGKAYRKLARAVGTKGSISTKKYQALLHRHLGFITDSHLAVGEEIFYEDVGLFSDESIHYVKTGERFAREDAPQDFITAIQGRPPENYLKRAIDEKGELTYYPYAMLRGRDNVSFRVEYESGRVENLTMRPAKYAATRELHRHYGYDRHDGWAYVEMNFAYMPGEMTKDRKQFLKDTADMKQQDRLVFDLRNNPGGDGTLIEKWFKRYTGKTLKPNYSTLRIRPVLLCNKEELRNEDTWARSQKLKREGKYYYTQYPGHQFLRNEGKQIFVLTSRMTSSAAEAMTDALKNVENVVTIGTNTGGVLANMANYSMAMPYSGLFLQFGECMQYFDKSYFREAYGMEPDIYITGKHIQERLDTFFENIGMR